MSTLASWPEINYKGEIEIYAEKTIVKEIDDYKVEITLEEAIEKEPEAEDLEVGDIFVEVIDPRVFGRRLITTAKQFFAQRLRDVERNYIYEDYATRIGEIIIGVVHQVQRDGVFINIEQAELRMPKNEQIFLERYRRGETIRAIIKSVEVTSKGPDIIVSKGLSLASSNVIDPLPERVKRKEPLKPISFKLFFRVSK